MIFFEFLFLIVFLLYLIKSIKQNGFKFIFNPNHIMIITWSLVGFLYNLALTYLYYPSIIINLLLSMIILTYCIMDNIIKTDIKNIKVTKYIDYEILKKDRRFTIVLLFLASFALYLTYQSYGFVIFNENKINKQQLKFGYFIFFSVLSGQISYINLRKNFNFKDVAIFIVSVLILIITLNRGPIFYIITSMILYEIKNSKKINSKVILFIILFVFLMGYIGDLRLKYVLENIYFKSLKDLYLMKVNLPNSLIWIYIYITSPLENARYAIENITLKKYTMFNQLFYPLIKFIANLFGKGNIYKEYVVSNTTYYPYLDNVCGLNVSSFIYTAFEELNIIGFLVYLVMYLLISFISIKILNNKNINVDDKIILYSNIVQILLWSIFVNSFAIGTNLLNIIIYAIYIKRLRNIKIKT